MEQENKDKYYIDVRTPSPRVRNYLALLIGGFMGTSKDFDKTVLDLYEKDKSEGTLEDEEEFMNEQE